MASGFIFARDVKRLSKKRNGGFSLIGLSDGFIGLLLGGVIGFFVGGFAGVVIACLAVMAGRTDHEQP